MKAIVRRSLATSGLTSRWMNFMRAISSEGYGRIRFFKQVRRRLIEDKTFRPYFDGESGELPSFFMDIIKKDLGSWWSWLPNGAIHHNSNAYLAKTLKKQMTKPFSPATITL